jgi:hypothetical protein
MALGRHRLYSYAATFHASAKNRACGASTVKASHVSRA